MYAYNHVHVDDNTWTTTRQSIIHYNDVIMGAIASLITSLAIVFSAVYLDTDQRKHQSSASLAFVRGIHRRPGNSPHKWPVTRKMFPFDDVIMQARTLLYLTTLASNEQLSSGRTCNYHIYGLMQDCSISIANALGSPQSCTKNIDMPLLILAYGGSAHCL